MLHYNEGKNDLFCFIDGYSGLNKLDTFNSQKTTLTSTLGLIYTSKSNEIKLLLESRDRVAKIIANPPLNLKTLNSIKTEYYNKQITILDICYYVITIIGVIKIIGSLIILLFYMMAMMILRLLYILKKRLL